MTAGATCAAAAARCCCVGHVRVTLSILCRAEALFGEEEGVTLCACCELLFELGEELYWKGCAVVKIRTRDVSSKRRNLPPGL